MTRNELSNFMSAMQAELPERMCVSLFTKGIANPLPDQRPLSYKEVFTIIKSSERLKELTERYRSTMDPNLKKALPYITPAGVFIVREERGLIIPSQIFCIDIDKIPEGRAKHPETGEEIDMVELIKYNIMYDPNVCTLATMRSPSGNGVKAFFWQPFPNSLSPIEAYPEMHRAIDMYIEKMHVAKYGGVVDKKCCDVARAAFLCYDPNALIRTDMKL